MLPARALQKRTDFKRKKNNIKYKKLQIRTFSTNFQQKCTWTHVKIGWRLFFLFEDHHFSNYSFKRIEWSFFFFLKITQFLKLICQYLRNSHQILIKKKKKENIRFAPDSKLHQISSKNIWHQIASRKHLMCIHQSSHHWAQGTQHRPEEEWVAYLWFTKIQADLLFGLFTETCAFQNCCRKELFCSYIFIYQVVLVRKHQRDFSDLEAVYHATTKLVLWVITDTVS